MAYMHPEVVSDLYARINNRTITYTDCFDTVEILLRVTEPPVPITVNGDTKGYCLMYNSLVHYPIPVCMVVFRGTQNLDDWSADAEVALVSLRTEHCTLPVKVHSGFLRRYCEMEAQIFQYVELHTPSTIVFTGHSLGSAVAAIAALCFAYEHPGCLYVGLGTPAVGDYGFAKAFEQYMHRWIRVKNSRDPVDSIIPSMGYYKHINKVLHVGSIDYLPLVSRPYFVSDHNINAYISSLRTYATQYKSTIRHKCTCFFKCAPPEI
jgi:hypothetical protein